MHTLSSDFGDCVTNQAIISHLSVHKNEFRQCAVCSTFHTSELSVVDHMLRDHPIEKLKFYHNPPAIDHIISVERVKVTLECNICDSDFETAVQAIAHYKDNHDNEKVNLTAISLIKRTDSLMKTQWSVTEMNSMVRQLFSCELCHHMEHTMHKMIVHHRDTHQSDALSFKLTEMLATVPKLLESATKTTDECLMYCCVHCQEKTNHSTLFSSIEDMYGHWLTTHTDMPNVLPFRFYVTEPMVCYRCGVMSTFSGLKTHFATEHPNESIVLHHHSNRKKCALCPYTGDLMAQHFENEHKLIVQSDVFNPICLTEECLNRLIAVNIHKKTKCIHCDDAFETDAELRVHLTRSHPTMKQESQNRFADQNVVVYVDCCQVKLTPINYLNHFLGHIMNFNCSSCPFTAQTISDIVCHEAHIHNRIDTVMERCAMYLDLARLHHFRTKILFGNGLVLINQNLLHTKYDDSRQCEALLKQMIDSEKGKFSKVK